MSFPNQKRITIHQSTEIPFVKIGIQEYKEAFRKMSPCSFAMYLYLAGNMEGFNLELSQAAFENATGYGKSSYHRAYKELENLGYIYKDNCGGLNFATCPHESYEIKTQDWEGGDAKKEPLIVKNESIKSQDCNEEDAKMNREINNKESKEDKEEYIDPNKKYYLETIVSPEGRIQSGRYQGYMLNYLFPNFWEMSDDEKVEKVKDKAQLSWADARIVVEYVLDEEKYKERREMYKILGF